MASHFIFLISLLGLLTTWTLYACIRLKVDDMWTGNTTKHQQQLQKNSHHSQEISHILFWGGRSACRVGKLVCIRRGGIISSTNHVQHREVWHRYHSFTHGEILKSQLLKLQNGHRSIKMLLYWVTKSDCSSLGCVSRRAHTSESNEAFKLF
jgi:hypothetical protein